MINKFVNSIRYVCAGYIVSRWQTNSTAIEKVSVLFGFLGGHFFHGWAREEPVKWLLLVIFLWIWCIVGFTYNWWHSYWHFAIIWGHLVATQWSFRANDNDNDNINCTSLVHTNTMWHGLRLLQCSVKSPCECYWEVYCYSLMSVNENRKSSTIWYLEDNVEATMHCFCVHFKIRTIVMQRQLSLFGSVWHIL